MHMLEAAFGGSIPAPCLPCEGAAGQGSKGDFAGHVLAGIASVRIISMIKYVSLKEVTPWALLKE